MKLLMKAEREGGIPAFARLLESVVLTNDICFKKIKERLVNVVQSSHSTYRKIPIMSPGQAFLLGLFSGELIFGGAYCWKEFSFQNGLGLTIKIAQNTRKTA